MRIRRRFAAPAAALGVSVALGLVVAGCASWPSHTNEGDDGDAGGETARPILRGVTVTTPQDAEATIRSVASLEAEPTVRIVLDLDADLGNDSGADFDQYRTLIEGLDPHAQLMVQVADSTELAQLSVDDIERRTRALVDAFGDRVDIWEVGNEINGEWAGTGPAEIVQKTAASTRIIEEAGGATAITFNYWSSPNCYSKSWEDAANFASALPEDVLANLDYLFLSVYDTACDPPQHPTAEDLANALTQLGQAAPGASLGIGEIGVQGTEDEHAPESLAIKQAVARRYMGMSDQLHDQLGERFVDGWFWWYFVEDAVQAAPEESLWPSLDELLKGL